MIAVSLLGVCQEKNVLSGGAEETLMKESYAPMSQSEKMEKKLRWLAMMQKFRA
jgi:hypothetical protein